MTLTLSLHTRWWNASQFCYLRSAPTFLKLHHNLVLLIKPFGDFLGNSVSWSSDEIMRSCFEILHGNHAFDICTSEHSFILINSVDIFVLKWNFLSLTQYSCLSKDVFTDLVNSHTAFCWQISLQNSKIHKVKWLPSVASPEKSDSCVCCLASTSLAYANFQLLISLYRV